MRGCTASGQTLRRRLTAGIPGMPSFVAALPPQTNICRMTKTRYRATMIAALRDAEPDGYGLLVQTNKTKRFAYRGV